MDKELRLIIRSNNDCDGITECIINQFRTEFDSVSGVVLDCNNLPRERDKDFEYLPASVFSTHNDLALKTAKLPLDGDVLEAMLPYKSMAMHIMMRTIHYDIYERKYLEDVYYKHLKYWNELLDVRRINYVLFMCLPHHVGEYILYALCKVKDIKVTILYPQLSYNGISYLLGNEIENVGDNIRREYEKISGTTADYDQLSDFMKGVVGNTKGNRVIGAQNWNKITSESKKMMYSTISAKIAFKLFVKNILCNIGLYNKCDKETVSNQYKYISRARRYEKKMDHLSDYRKFSVFPVENEPYIYFPLQMTPEASTMPLAGEFKNQLLSIELLASAAKAYGLHVYVKEHWVQYNRDAGFYKSISEIDNVRIIDLACNSIDLIDGCVAVSSQTGNCLFEAMIKGKYAIAIGEGCAFKGAPNIFEVQNRNQISDALDCIINNKVAFTENDVNNYLLAIDRCMVYSYLDSLSETVSVYSKEDSARKIVDFTIENLNVNV